VVVGPRYTVHHASGWLLRRALYLIDLVFDAFVMCSIAQLWVFYDESPDRLEKYHPSDSLPSYEPLDIYSAGVLGWVS